MGTFSEKLSTATNEDKQVNHIYVQAIEKELPKIGNDGHGVVNWMNAEVMVYPDIRTDGIYNCYYIDGDNGLRCNYLLQLECKLDVDFNNKEERAKVLLQVAAYLRQIKDKEVGYLGDWNSNSIPRVIVLASKINCLALPAKLLHEYAGRIVNAKSASTTYREEANKLILTDIINDANIEVHSIIYNTDDKNCINSLCTEIAKLGRGLQITDDLSESTISKAFDFFDMYVLDVKFAKNLSSREKVSLFIGLFFSDEFTESRSRKASYYDMISVNGIEVKVNPDYYNKFKLLYSTREYNRLEQKRITAITDRLIEDTDRRRRGDFYTPTVWVDEAHKLLDKNLGENWRDEYIVWDCAWGTGNLTRDYTFADLYCSTLNQEELNIGARYNKNAVKFQYDFLNDDVKEMEQIKAELRRPLMLKAGINVSEMEKQINFAQILDLYCEAIDKGLMTQTDGQIAYNRAINILKSTKLYQKAPTLVDGLLGGEDGEQQKKLLFLINPPYGASTNVKSTTLSGEAKIGTNSTLIQSQMNENKIGAASQNLYTQFIYRIDCLQKMFGMEIKLGIFCPPAYITGKNAKTLRNKLGLWFTDGFLLQANQFADVSEGWGISFELLEKSTDITNRSSVCMSIKTNQEGKVENISQKAMYNMDNQITLTDWIRRNIKAYKAEDAPQMKSALNWSNEHKLGNLVKGAYGYLVDSGNNVDENTSRVFWLTSCRGAGHGVSALNENFEDCCSAFSARKLISGEYATWINCKDEYMIPNTEHPLYEQWQSDCIVYSLFNTASNQSSLRNIEYNGKTWNIFNEFFWMSVQDIRKLAESTSGADAVCDDLDMYGKERFVYKKLQTATLSPDAQAVLDKATELLKSSFVYRAEFDKKHPEYHIMSWDAGWYQIKGMLKEYDSDGLKQFNELYKQLEDRMRPLVYELGFLYK